MSETVPIYWTMEGRYAGRVQGFHTDHVADVDVRTEVPMRGDTQIERFGHRYYPTWIDLSVSDGIVTAEIDLWPEQARALAAKLVAAADAADAADLPDFDLCGHWAPCDCEKSAYPASQRPPSPHSESA